MDEQERAQSFPGAQLSLRSVLGAMLIGLSLLAGIIWLGQVVSAGNEPSGSMRIEDASRALVFVVDPATSDVRVLNIRGGISEVARFHEAQRHAVRSLALDASRRWLQVQADDATYVYDLHNFKLSRRAAVAERTKTERMTASLAPD